jgi:ATP-dependent DNA helicase RecG
MHLPINISDLLHHAVVETDRLEFKKSWNPESTLQTICAFANDFNHFGGGYIVIGVEEIDGKPIFPPIGIQAEQIDKIQKDIVRICSFLKPIYTPIISLEKYQNKNILIIWVPGGQSRPYSAPTTLGKEKDYKYFIRKGSTTVIAKNEELKELLGLATTPFDDRTNHHSTLEDLKLPLIQSFLKEIKSQLLEDSRQISFTDLCRQMVIVNGGNEYLKPRNIGLLFFNDQPEKIFPYAQIEVVYFPDDEGGDVIQEEIFKGPLDHQLRSALRHIRNNFISERILKIPGQARAKRFFNYPYEAIEEALVNAVYHRSYEIREPIEVRINRTSISVVSHPGPDASITATDIKMGKMLSRRYRNRRIGEFLKELEFTEGRGTGVPKMRRALQANGSPEPTFYTDDGRLSFWTTIHIHPEFLVDYGPEEAPVEVHDQVYDEVHDQVYDKVTLAFSETELRILNLIKIKPMSKNDILAEFGYQVLTGNIRIALNNLLALKLVAYTLPDKPRSKRQQYRITEQGKEALKK